MPYQLPTYPQLIAHRGYSGAFPENTRLAIEAAIRLDVDMVEVDVRLSKDGVPVLIHYPTLDQTTNGKGRVDAHVLSELKQLDCGSWKDARFAGERILTLYECLELVRHRVPLNIDLKTNQAISVVLRAIREMQMNDDVVITGCRADCVRKIRSLAPELTVLINHRSLVYTDHIQAFQANYLAAAKRVGAAGINAHHSILDRSFIQEVQSEGLTVWAWTVDDEIRFSELLQAGVNAITTNWPEQMRQLSDDYRRGIDTGNGS